MKRPPICREVASSECIFVGDGGSKVGFLIAEAPLAILGPLCELDRKRFFLNLGNGWLLFKHKEYNRPYDKLSIRFMPMRTRKQNAKRLKKPWELDQKIRKAPLIIP